MELDEMKKSHDALTGVGDDDYAGATTGVRDEKTSLFREYHIGFTILVLVLLLGNAALFIASNVSVAAIVWMDINVPDIPENTSGGFGGLLANLGITLGNAITDQVDPEPIAMFEFSLVSSITMMWESQTYWLAVLIVVASGVWPYIKIVIMSIMWFVPMKNKVRGTLVRTLEVLGKWSLIDMYVLCIMVIAFPVLVNVVVEVNVFVEPVFGFYAFLFAALWNMFNNVVVGQFHYRYMRKVSGPAQYTSSRKPVGYMGAQERSGSVMAVYSAVGTLLALGAIVTTIGFFLGSYHVYTSGLAVQFSDFDGDVITRTFSAITTGTALPESTYPTGSCYATMVIFILFTVAIPMLWMLTMLVTWFTPMPGRAKHYLVAATEFLFGWSTMDVYLVSIGAAVVELHQLAEGTMPDFCKQVASLSEAAGKGTTCFSIEAEFATGFWVLLAGVVALYVGYFFLVFAASRAEKKEKSLVKKGESEW